MLVQYPPLSSGSALRVGWLLNINPRLYHAASSTVKQWRFQATGIAQVKFWSIVVMLTETQLWHSSSAMHVAYPSNLAALKLPMLSNCSHWQSIRQQYDNSSTRTKCNNNSYSQSSSHVRREKAHTLQLQLNSQILWTLEHSCTWNHLVGSHRCHRLYMDWSDNCWDLSHNFHPENVKWRVCNIC